MYIAVSFKQTHTHGEKKKTKRKNKKKSAFLGVFSLKAFSKVVLSIVICMYINRYIH